MAGSSRAALVGIGAERSLSALADQKAQAADEEAAVVVEEQTGGEVGVADVEEAVEPCREVEVEEEVTGRWAAVRAVRLEPHHSH